MKKVYICLLLVIFMLAAAACSDPAANETAPQTEESEAVVISEVLEPSSSAMPSAAEESAAAEDDTTGLTENKEQTSGSNILVTYFSSPDEEDNSYVVINGEQFGNTQYMANVIAENTGADIFRIERTSPYPTNHEELLEAAQNEISENARPEIAGTIENLNDYEIIFVGYPNWYADMPNILYTFFDTYDLSGKVVIPFNTHGGSGFSDTINTIAELEPNAEMLEGKSISRNSIEGAEQEIIEWLGDIGMLN